MPASNRNDRARRCLPRIAALAPFLPFYAPASLATAANAVDHAVERRVLPVDWIVRIHQAFLRGHLISTRLAVPHRCLRQQLLFRVHRRSCGWISRASRLRNRHRRGSFLLYWARMSQTIVAEIRPGHRVVGLVMLCAIGRISAARYHGAGVPVVAGVVVSVAVGIIIGVVVSKISIGVVVATVAITQRATSR